MGNISLDKKEWDRRMAAEKHVLENHTGQSKSWEAKKIKSEAELKELERDKSRNSAVIKSVKKYIKYCKDEKKRSDKYVKSAIKEIGVLNKNKPIS
jgi:CTP-dependent riboflavin kinase